MNMLLRFAVAIGLAFAGLHTAKADLINGSFELFGQAAGTESDHNDASIDPSIGWFTTESDHQIEVWGTNFLGVPAYDGTDFAELNANAVGTLYQFISGIPSGAIVGFQFAHRGRLGVDTMQFTVTDTVTNAVLFQQQYSDDNTAWGFYQGTGIVATGDTLEFSYDSISAAGGNPSIGNFLDDAHFGVGIGSTAPEPSFAYLLFPLMAGVLGLSYRRHRKAIA